MNISIDELLQIFAWVSLHSGILVKTKQQIFFVFINTKLMYGNLLLWVLVLYEWPQITTRDISEREKWTFLVIFHSFLSLSRSVSIFQFTLSFHSVYAFLSVNIQCYAVQLAMQCSTFMALVDWEWETEKKSKCIFHTRTGTACYFFPDFQHAKSERNQKILMIYWIWRFFHHR